MQRDIDAGSTKTTTLNFYFYFLNFKFGFNVEGFKGFNQVYSIGVIPKPFKQ